MNGFKPKRLMSREEAQLSRHWCAPMSVTYAGNDCRLSYAGTRQLASGVDIVYAWNEQEIVLRVMPNNVCEFLDPELQGLALEDLSEELQALFFEALGDVIKDLFAGLNQVLTYKTAKFENISKQQVCLELTSDKQLLCQIGVDKTALEFIEQVAQTYASTGPVTPEKIHFVFGVEIGRAHLSLQEIRTLRCGDIILNQMPSDYVRCYCGSKFFTGKRENNTIFVTKGLMSEKEDLPVGIIPEENESESVAEEEEVQQTSKLTQEAIPQMDQLPVTISFDVGKQTLSVNQLSQLHEGYTFELEQKVEDDVQILANGQIIGQGRWVQIDEHLGVQITHLRS